MIAGLIGCSVAVAITEDVHSTDGLLSVRSTQSYPKRFFRAFSSSLLLSPFHRSIDGTGHGMENLPCTRTREVCDPDQL